jgi:hypothetical protein
MINWRHPLQERPISGQKVFVIDVHWKKQIPGSFWIIGGTYQEHSGHGAVWENDDHGGGSDSIDWPVTDLDLKDGGSIVGAWVPANEINLPKWLVRNG